MSEDPPKRAGGDEIVREIENAEVLAYPAGAKGAAKPARGQQPDAGGGQGSGKKPPRGPWKPRDSGEPPDDDDGRVVIWRSASTRAREVREAMSALASEPSEFYVCGTKIVRPELVTIAGVDDELKTAPGLAEASIATIAGALDHRTRWQVFDKRANDWVGKNSPKDICEQILACGGTAKFPPIAGIIAAPAMRPDGSIISALGYDSKSHLFYLAKKEMEIDPVPTRPSRAQADEALEDLSGLIEAFPFVSDIDRAVALSGLMTPVLRSAMDVAPLHAYSAPTPATGKTALTHLSGILSIGQKIPLIVASDDPVETEKRLVSALISGTTIICLDNISGALRSNTLAQSIEQEILRIRPLGEKYDIFVPNRASFFANGNGLAIEGDNLRRCLLCNLDAGVERPEFRQFDSDPIGIAFLQRAKYVRAILTLGVFGLQEAQHSEPPLASFNRWDAIVRRPLLALGCCDPVASMETARAGANDLSGARTILTLLRRAFGDRGFTVREVIAAATSHKSADLLNHNPVGDLSSDDRAELREALLTAVGDRGSISGKRLGKWLARHKRRVYGTFRITDRDRDLAANVAAFAVLDTRA